MPLIRAVGLQLSALDQCSETITEPLDQCSETITEPRDQCSGTVTECP